LIHYWLPVIFLILLRRSASPANAFYKLRRRESEALSLEVVDSWQADASRDIKTLSGPENLLVSLALALAVSDLVCDRSRVDLLFLDEGLAPWMPKPSMKHHNLNALVRDWYYLPC